MIHVGKEGDWKTLVDSIRRENRTVVKERQATNQNADIPRAAHYADPVRETSHLLAGRRKRSIAAALSTGLAMVLGWAGCGQGIPSQNEGGVRPDVTMCPGICNAATPSYPAIGPSTGQGNITMYTTEASNGGACNYGLTKVVYFAAVNVNIAPNDGLGQWQGGRVCGQCLEVTALTTQGPQSVVVRIMDKCPDGYCGIDLGGLAPAAIMGDGFGRYDGSWRFVSCAGHPEVSDGPTSLTVSAGANAYWSRVQVRNPPDAVESIAWRDSQGGRGVLPYATDPENTFEVPPSLMQSTVATITVTAQFSDGTTAAVRLSPGQLSAEDANYAME